VYQQVHIPHPFDCNSGGGKAKRLDNANIAFGNERSQSVSAGGLGGYARFLASHPAGSLYSYNGGHYRVTGLGPTISLPLSNEVEGC
jgi:hypothetical protein